VHAEVLGKNSFGRVANPVGEEEGRVFGEIAVVEDEEELGAVGAETLERVGMARWEVPQVALFEIVDEATALGVEGGDADSAFEHVRPLGLLVPMKLADDAFVQTHVHAGKLLAHAELADGGLARPAALFDPDVRVGEGPAKVGDGSMIGARWADDIGILSFSRPVARPQYISAIAVSLKIVS
jgi:hypothetical protein